MVKELEFIYLLNEEGKEEKINIDVMDSTNKEFTKKQVEDLKKLRGIK